jgi:peptidoglycan hydrolase-like protein with peptidoglycan-binding domain
MRDFFKVVATAAWMLPAGSVLAQDAWVQVEAQPGLTRAQSAASAYAQRLQNVAGFRLGQSNWYAVVIGPFEAGQAASVRSQLRSSGAIPADAFVSDGSSYTTQFWPIGAEADAATATPEAEAAPQPVAEASPEAEAEPESEETGPRTPDQTVTEARAAESQLSRDGRIEVQRHLRRLGFYDAGLDGAFGRGTRDAMARWQQARNFPTTGVLTEGQRAELAQDYADVVAEEGRLPETPAEARASEALLDRAARERLQVALQWAGVYEGPIDGAFGRGTRSAMGDWQAQKGYEVTGVLTTRQRQELIDDYNAILADLDLQEVVDDTAGIALTMPTGLVEFARYEPPFAQYNAIEEGAPYRVILISQRGDRDTLGGLYEIMQTLEIVPEDGPRERSDSAFTLTGENDEIVSHTEARLTDGAIKGFTLVWPAGDEDRRSRLLDEMRASFRPVSGVVMDDRVRASAEDQRIDLVSGLRIRRPELSRTGFFIDESGTVLTTDDVLQECGKITLDDDIEASVAATDDASGLALLRPQRSLAPLDYARFTTDVPRLQTELAVAGYSFEGVLGAPSLTFGTLADIRGLNGEDGVDRMELAPQPGDYGGPVLNDTGAVTGMLLPRVDEDGRVLPDGVSFVADAGAIRVFLEQNGAEADFTGRSGNRTTAELTQMAAEMTTLVSCWD